MLEKLSCSGPLSGVLLQAKADEVLEQVKTRLRSMFKFAMKVRKENFKFILKIRNDSDEIKSQLDFENRNESEKNQIST